MTALTGGIVSFAGCFTCSTQWIGGLVTLLWGGGTLPLWDGIRVTFLGHPAHSLITLLISMSQLHGDYLLTYSMVQSPSWEANWFAASQEIPRISWNPKVHYRTHNRPPPVSILGQPNPIHMPTSHLLEIHPNIIHPSMPRSPQWSPSLRFPHQDPMLTPLLTHTCHMPSPSHSPWWLICGYHNDRISLTAWYMPKENCVL